VILARVRRTILERALLSRGERVLVACSGGPDSAALLHVLQRLAPALGLTLHAASVDHGLRPGAASEVALAGALAASLGVPFTPLAVTVAREGASLQAQARDARYDVLFAEAARVGARALAVGHTLDDQAETVLARLLRGSSVSGLAGIAPRRADGVVRPLIDCRREEVHAYVARHGLCVAADPSNVDLRYERARIRASVLPALAAEDASVAVHLAQLADDARETAEAVGAAAAELLSRAEVEGGLDAAAVLDAPRAVRMEALSRFARRLTGVPAGRAHLLGLERALEGRGECLLPGGWLVRLVGRVLAGQREPGAKSRSHPRRPE
jgi:tRNA(Ile)-lysidine synthase